MRRFRKSPFPNASCRAAARQRGIYALAFAVLMLPLIAVVGCAVDYARVVQYKSDLQNAVDEAALAGAAALTNSDATTNSVATAIATNYFNRAILPPSLSVSAPTVVANNSGTATLPNGNGAYSVKVSASATVSNTLFSMFIPSENLSATATAAEPLVTANITIGKQNDQACDLNTLYIYPVSKTSDGTAYDYSINGVTSLPTTSFVQVLPTAVLPPIAANQPLGVELKNQTNGICGGTSPNSYGAANNATNTFYSSLLPNGMSPSENNNNLTYTATTLSNKSNGKITSISVKPVGTGASTTATGNSLSLSTYTGNANCVASSTTTSGSTVTTNYTCTTIYKQQNGSATALGNCSLYVQTGVTQAYVNGLNGSSPAPTASSGHCSNPSQAGAQYAAPTCAQLSALANGGNAPSAVFWWNDGGGAGTDDYDYNDAYFAANCTVSGGNADGNTEVVLVQ